MPPEGIAGDELQEGGRGGPSGVASIPMAHGSSRDVLANCYAVVKAELAAGGLDAEAQGGEAYIYRHFYIWMFCAGGDHPRRVQGPVGHRRGERRPTASGSGSVALGVCRGGEMRGRRRMGIKTRRVALPGWMARCSKA